MATAEQYQRCAPLLAVLRERGVQMRYDRANHSMVWSPKPSEWPEVSRLEMRELVHDLIALLVPSNDPYARRRPGWKLGPVEACIGCGASVVILDPLGQPRHDNCGDLNQAPAYRHTGHSVRQRKERQQG